MPAAISKLLSGRSPYVEKLRRRSDLDIAPRTADGELRLETGEETVKMTIASMPLSRFRKSAGWIQAEWRIVALEEALILLQRWRIVLTRLV
jgi:hypothetical protein